MPLKVAIIGRPNVGKSTLFNRLAGRKLAIVHDKPGVTRDRKETEAKLQDMKLLIIDTAGYEYSNEDETISRPLRQLPGFSNFAELRDGNFAGLMEAFDSKYKEENGRHFLLSMPRAARLRKFLERIELEIDSTNIEIKATFKDKTTFKAKLHDIPAAKAD